MDISNVSNVNLLVEHCTIFVKSTMTLLMISDCYKVKNLISLIAQMITLQQVQL